MMRHWYIHATSYECGKKIIKEGFSRTRNTTWNVSFADYIYLRRIPEQIEDDEELVEILENSVSNAAITASLFNSRHSKIYFFLFYLDEEILDEDTSCDNMTNCYEIHIDDINKELANAKVLTINGGYIKECRYIYLKESVENSLLNSSLLSSEELLMLECMETIDYGPLFDEEWRIATSNLFTKIAKTANIINMCEC